MGKVEIKSIKGTKHFGGFSEEYPKELEGIIPVKEYLDIIDCLNYNGIRDFYSIIIILIGYILFGLVIILVSAIIEFIRWSIFKSKLKRDLNKCLEGINMALEPRQAYITLHMSFSGVVTLTFNYPNSTTINSNEMILLDGTLGNAILVHPWAQPNHIVNPLVHSPDDQPDDINFRNILVSRKLEKFSWSEKNFQGWNVFYNLKLYNYLSSQEYTSMMEEYNTLSQSIKFNHHCYKFFLASFILIFALIGLVLIIPASIWFVIENNKFIKTINYNIDVLNNKYNSIYYTRGIQFINKNGKLFITIPKDVGQAPIVTKYSGSKQLILAPTIPNGILPFYQVNCAPPQNFEPVFEKNI
ncbi:hypothetical protein DICPUDRAFT_78212 [Dictyostelium purpureum]|uniref:Uncharacterized protein n=1 Tax=Dictyostelium purpureum TaxID=5786 RepID=F0ZIW4_DICPU|nr:uncharacterized protein DICPUDRAFT_78212 [Dictyostelium purpureum]EGC36112.1 hypothetical protein DICPUDRAFT_78212 [Dictyostelium purpureum]|eukprot:XP_003287369.1 hypothetical protein DICPUDRAFT_78212 [Dictyostelium purpureum]